MPAWFLRAFLGELGDKTFWLTVVLAAWCPWQGIRSTQDGALARCQQGLVFAGAAAALSARALLLAMFGIADELSASFEVITTACLLLLLPKLWHDASLAERDEEQRTKLLESASKRPFSGMIPTMSGAVPKDESGSDEDAAADYGTLHSDDAEGQYGASKDKDSGLAATAAAEQVMESYMATLFAWIVPMFLVYCAEAEDKSQAAWTHTLPSGQADVAWGLLGIVVATALAVFIGFVLERQVSNHRIAWTAFSAFTAIALMSLSQAMLRVLEIRASAASAEKVTAALLSVFTVTLGGHSWSDSSTE